MEKPGKRWGQSFAQVIRFQAIRAAWDWLPSPVRTAIIAVPAAPLTALWAYYRELFSAHPDIAIGFVAFGFLSACGAVVTVRSIASTWFGQYTTYTLTPTTSDQESLAALTIQNQGRAAIFDVGMIYVKKMFRDRDPVWFGTFGGERLESRGNDPAQPNKIEQWATGHVLLFLIDGSGNIRVPMSGGRLSLPILLEGACAVECIVGIQAEPRLRGGVHIYACRFFIQDGAPRLGLPPERISDLDRYRLSTSHKARPIPPAQPASTASEPSPPPPRESS